MSITERDHILELVTDFGAHSMAAGQASRSPDARSIAESRQRKAHLLLLNALDEVTEFTDAPMTEPGFLS